MIATQHLSPQQLTVLMQAATAAAAVLSRNDSIRSPEMQSLGYEVNNYISQGASNLNTEMFFTERNNRDPIQHLGENVAQAARRIDNKDMEKDHIHGQTMDFVNNTFQKHQNSLPEQIKHGITELTKTVALGGAVKMGTGATSRLSVSDGLRVGAGMVSIANETLKHTNITTILSSVAGDTPQTRQIGSKLDALKNTMTGTVDNFVNENSIGTEQQKLIQAAEEAINKLNQGQLDSFSQVIHSGGETMNLGNRYSGFNLSPNIQNMLGGR